MSGGEFLKNASVRYHFMLGMVQLYLHSGVIGMKWSVYRNTEGKRIFL